MMWENHERALAEPNLARKRRLVAMLIAYGDDSSDRTRSTVFAVGMLIGTQDQWDRFKLEWDERTGGTPFHATDCESGWGSYRGMDRQARKDLYRDLVVLLSTSDLWGFSSAISIKAFRQVHPADKTYEMAYYACFASTLAMCAALGHVTIPPQSIDLVFDRNFERDPSTDLLYSYLGAWKGWRFHDNLGERISFADHRQESGIQAADLLTRETMKHMENTMLHTRERWSRASYVELRRNPRLHFHFIDRNEMELIVGSTFFKEGEPSYLERYQRWREENGIQGDSVVNRIRFMQLLDQGKVDHQAVQEDFD